MDILNLKDLEALIDLIHFLDNQIFALEDYLSKEKMRVVTVNKKL